MPKGNPEPTQPPEFLERQYSKAYDVPDSVVLAKSPTSVKLPKDLDKAVKSLSHPASWLRRIIAEAWLKEFGEIKPSEKVNRSLNKRST